MPPLEYDKATYEFDLALIYLDEKVPFGDNVRPVCLPERGRPLEDLRGKFGMGFVTGWGTLWEGKASITREFYLQGPPKRFFLG